MTKDCSPYICLYFSIHYFETQIHFWAAIASIGAVLSECNVAGT